MATKRTVFKLSALIGLAALSVGLLLVVLNWSRLVAWLEFQRQFERLPDNTQGYSEYRHLETGIVFVRIPGRTFRMGSPETEVRSDDSERPMHAVVLSSFLIGKFELTQAQWRDVMGETPSRFSGDDLPVERVSWEDCQRFCELTGFALPSEAQWEYACRAGTSTPFSYGSTITNADVNYDGTKPYGDAATGRRLRKTLPVESFQPNAFGLYQMHGNVWEWCVDAWDGQFYDKPEASGRDPVCAADTESRVVRGGSWYSVARDCRSGHREFCGQSTRLDVVGFRPVKPLP